MLYSSAVWAIWLTYLKWSYGEGPLIHGDALVHLFKDILLRQMHEDRLLALNSQYANSHYNPAAFSQVWRQTPGCKASARGDLWILH